MACENCPYSIEHNKVLIANYGETGLAVDADHSLHYMYVNQNGLGMGKLSIRDMDMHIPEWKTALESCEGPQQVSVNRGGLLGMVGLSKTVTICPVVEQFSLNNPDHLVSFLDRAYARISVSE